MEKRIMCAQSSLDNYQNQQFWVIMIKQSFLRNYSLSKITSHADLEKKKLQVFYARQVDRIIKQRRQAARDLSDEMRGKEHRHERLKLKQRVRQLNDDLLTQHKSTLRRTKTKTNRKNTESQQQRSVEQVRKVELFITDLSLNSCFSTDESNHESLKITTVPNRSFHQGMLHSIMNKFKSQQLQLFQPYLKKQPLSKLKKAKFNTNPSFHTTFENFDLDAKKSLPAKVLKKTQVKRAETSKVLLSKRILQTQMSAGILQNSKLNTKFIDELKSKGIIPHPAHQDAQ